VDDGDLITIDIPEGKLELNLSSKELEERKSRKDHVDKKADAYGRKFLVRYSQLVSGADKGAIMESDEPNGGDI
jgi:dihydroxy-acid dehydratase